MYFSGAAVILPGCTIAPLLAAAQTIPYLPFDDTFLTGLCTSKAGIKVRDSYWYVNLRFNCVTTSSIVLFAPGCLLRG